MTGPNPDEDRDWVESLTKLAGALGFNEVRVRWKLIRLRQSMKRAERRTEQQVVHIKYEHKTCPKCGRVNDRYAVKCVGCGDPLTSRGWQVFERVGLSIPNFLSVSTLLGVALLVVYARIMVANPGDGYLSMNGDVLVRHGANWPIATFDRQWWRLGTYIFLHIGLWHLGFNLLALAQIGPAIEKLFGRSRMLFFFMLTGVAAGVGSAMLGPKGISAGASGAIMGLIGVGAGWGQRDGTTIGRDIRNRMVKWAIYTLGFGFLIGADNAAHGVGFAVGAVLGYLTPATWYRRHTIGPVSVLLGLVGALTAAAAMYLAVVPPKVSERWAQAATPAGRLQQLYEGFARACSLRDQGKRTEAEATLRAAMGKGWSLTMPDGADYVDATCGYYEDVKRQCGLGPPGEPAKPEPSEGEDEEDLEQTCDAVRKAQENLKQR